MFALDLIPGNIFWFGPPVGVVLTLRLHRFWHCHADRDGRVRELFFSDGAFADEFGQRGGQTVRVVWAASQKLSSAPRASLKGKSLSRTSSCREKA
jgi:hypothetical protein